jgi:hypothetical protein
LKDGGLGKWARALFTQSNSIGSDETQQMDAVTQRTVHCVWDRRTFFGPFV